MVLLNELRLLYHTIRWRNIDTHGKKIYTSGDYFSDRTADAIEEHFSEYDSLVMEIVDWSAPTFRTIEKVAGKSYVEMIRKHPFKFFSMLNDVSLRRRELNEDPLLELKRYVEDSVVHGLSVAEVMIRERSGVKNLLIRVKNKKDVDILDDDAFCIQESLVRVTPKKS